VNVLPKLQVFEEMLGLVDAIEAKGGKVQVCQRSSRYQERTNHLNQRLYVEMEAKHSCQGTEGSDADT